MEMGLSIEMGDENKANGNDEVARGLTCAKHVIPRHNTSIFPFISK